MRHETEPERAAARSRVTPLRNLHGHKIAEGDPDVRGWEVAGGDGERIGSVNDLLVDTAAGRVRYLDIQVDPGLFPDHPQDRHPQDSEVNPSLAGASTITEFLVRESLSDEENRLTADHHLDARHYPGERHAVFPVGQAEVDETRDRIVLTGLSAADAANLPPYVPGEIDPDYEQALRRWFDPSFTPAAGEDLYAHDLYDDERFYRRRRAALPTRED